MDVDQSFEILLEYLKRTRGFDFTGYKRGSLARRVAKRLQALEMEDFAAYTDYLEVHPDEFAELFNTILINVTSFFRDADVWRRVATDVVPRIIANKAADQPIRIWCAGCASGEEAYTIAILFCEALGIEQFRTRVKLYATDADRRALAEARLATYQAKNIEALGPALSEKYFEEAGDQYVFRQDLRRAIIFGEHDLIKDAPISRLDLLSCRNTLMYFNAEAQARVAARLQFALAEQGFLILGKAEMLFTQNAHFAPFDLKERIFLKSPRPGGRGRLLTTLGPDPSAEPGENLSEASMLRDAAFEKGLVANFVIDAAGILVMANERARSLARLSMADIGRRARDLEMSYRPVELRPSIDQVYAERRTVILKDAPAIGAKGDPQFFDIQLVPVTDIDGGILGVSILFNDVTRYRELQEKLDVSHREIATANEELQSTNEELETTNEELQSTVEELETTNEELQSTNEELETMNEELQSTNEELQSLNGEMRRRSVELSHANSFVNAVLASVQQAVIVVDRDLCIRVWNSRAEDLWGLKSQEVVGKHILNIDTGLPVELIRSPIKSCLTGLSEMETVTIRERNRRGRAVECDITCSSVHFDDGTGVAALIMIKDRETEGGES